MPPPDAADSREAAIRAAVADDLPDVSPPRPGDAEREPEPESREAEPGGDGDAFSAALLDEAEELGFSEKQAREFGTPENLERALNRIDEASRSRRKDDREDEGAPAGRAGAKADGKADEKDEDKPFELAINKEELDPELAKTLEALVEHSNARDARHRAERRELEKRLAGAEKRAEAREAAADIASFENAVKALGEDYEDILGKGLTVDLRRTSRAYRLRMLLVREIQDIEDRAAGRGARLSREASLDRALREVLPDVTKRRARAEVKDDVDRRRRSGLGRPRRAKGKALTGRKAAEAREDRFNREHPQTEE